MSIENGQDRLVAPAKQRYRQPGIEMTPPDAVSHARGRVACCWANWSAQTGTRIAWRVTPVGG